jgi:haloacetate dehalogenase
MSHALFPETREHRITHDGAELFARVGGKGPPLLLLHGFPQTHANWHTVAPTLMERFTCVLADLRGYGYSSCPPNDASNRPYAKRTMARDAIALMASLGYHRFAAVGHDRGGRVIYRMALDHPDILTCAGLIDIVPTHAMWHGMNQTLAMKVYHWLFLAQPHPLPEMLIERAPIGYLDFTLASWTKRRDLSCFSAEALAEYRLHYATPEHIHATCNDYRAGQTCDLADDEADLAAGRKIRCPVLVISGDAGIPAGHCGTVETDDPVSVWRQWCENVEGVAIDSGHFVMEENPEAFLAALLPFLDAHAV